MIDRAKLLDENFIKSVKENRLPVSYTDWSLKDTTLTKKELMDLFESQVISRHIDLQARILKEKNLGFYTIASCGHEGNAVLGKVFNHTDMAFLHYRSAALMIQRSKQLPDTKSIRDQLLSLLAARDDPCSGGRHKVFGSYQLSVPPQTSTIASHLPKAVGMAFSINKAKELHLAPRVPFDSVVLCSFGDASVNHSTALGAFNAASWITQQKHPLPLVFVCEDNGWGISVKTPMHWIEENFKDKPYLHYIKADGLNILDVYLACRRADELARIQRVPVFLHLKLVRLLGHAGSDIEEQYRPLGEIEQTEMDDPLLHSARLLIENNCLSRQEVLDKYLLIKQQVAIEVENCQNSAKLQSALEVKSSLIPPSHGKIKQRLVEEETRKATFAENFSQLQAPRNLNQHINFALTDLMLQHPELVIFGEDVGKKGGVYRVTADLQKRFGQRRVFDTLLDEQTILGTAIGLAHNGFIPIPEIQFLAYLHNAEDQIRGEAATLPFFSKGQFANPMVVRIPGMAYQKGFGGHFHNDNSLAVLRDIPGIIIALPSFGADAAKMLRECVRLAKEENRVVIFIEPIALYMTKDLHEAGDNLWLSHYPKVQERIAFGELGIYGQSKQCVIISFGNGFYLSRQAQAIIQKQTGIEIKVVDLRWLAPLNHSAIIQQVQGCKNILIVDEERQTGSVSEALMSLFLENLTPLPKIKRLTGADCFIPLGEAWKYVLPTRDEIVDTAIQMLTDH